MKKYIISAILFLSIIPCFNIKSVGNMFLDCSIGVSAAISKVLFGLKIGEAIQQKSAKKLLGLPALAWVGFTIFGMHELYLKNKTAQGINLSQLMEHVGGYMKFNFMLLAAYATLQIKLGLKERESSGL